MTNSKRGMTNTRRANVINQTRPNNRGMRARGRTNHRGRGMRARGRTNDRGLRARGTQTQVPTNGLKTNVPQSRALQHPIHPQSRTVRVTRKHVCGIAEARCHSLTTATPTTSFSQ